MGTGSQKSPPCKLAGQLSQARALRESQGEGGWAPLDETLTSHPSTGTSRPVTAPAYERVRSPLHALGAAASSPRPGHCLRGVDSGQGGRNKQFKCPRCLEIGLTRYAGKTLLV